MAKKAKKTMKAKKSKKRTKMKLEAHWTQAGGKLQRKWIDQ